MQERWVAEWFGVKRNALSGRNNSNDDGSPRLGDIVHPVGVVEVKRRKDVSLELGRAIAKLSRKLKPPRPWLVVEFKTGQIDMVKLTMNKETAAKVCNFINLLWGTKNGLD